MSGPFAVDYCDLPSVIEFAKGLARKHPVFAQYVVKYPGRENFNITMQRTAAESAGAAVVWSSTDSN